jgi:hypothetical protein
MEHCTDLSGGCTVRPHPAVRGHVAARVALRTLAPLTAVVVALSAGLAGVSAEGPADHGDHHRGGDHELRTEHGHGDQGRHDDAGEHEGGNAPAHVVTNPVTLPIPPRITSVPGTGASGAPQGGTGTQPPAISAPAAPVVFVPVPPPADTVPPPPSTPTPPPPSTVATPPPSKPLPPTVLIPPLSLPAPTVINVVNSGISIAPVVVLFFCMLLLVGALAVRIGRRRAH